MTERPTTVRYRVLAWLVVVAALSYLCRNAVGVAESTIRGDLGLTLEQSGWFMGAFFWTYASLQVPGGWFAQHYGTRFTLPLLALVSSAAAFVIGIAPGLGLLIASQLAMGVAQAGVFPACMNSISHWIPMSERSLACGTIGAGMQIGAIAASILTGIFMALVGWRGAFILFALPGILWSLGFYARFQERPEQATGINDGEVSRIGAGREVGGSSRQASAVDLPANRGFWPAVACSPAIWFLCGQQVCRAFGYVFFTSWFPTFLQTTRGVTVLQAGYLQSLVLLGTLTGAIVGGLLTDSIWRRTGSLRWSRSGVGAASLAACALLILAAFFVESALPAVAVLAAGALFAALAGPCGTAVTIDMGGQRVPQLYGLMNMSGNFASAACPVVVGNLFAWTAEWNWVLLLFAGVHLAGAILWLFVDPRAGLRRKERFVATV